MTDSLTGGTGGGSATSSGTTFQDDVICYFSALILAENLAEPPAELPQSVHLVSIHAESFNPIDDIRLITSDEGVLYIQAKTSLSLSQSHTSDFAKVIDQFVRQTVRGVVLPNRTDRKVEHERDRFILAVGYSSPATISVTLSDVLTKCRKVVDEDGFHEFLGLLNNSEQKAIAIVRNHIQRLWNDECGVSPSIQDELSILRLIYVIQFDLRAEGADYARARDLLRGHVLRDPTKAGDAWNSLIRVCRSFSPERSGGNVVYLRNQLLNNEIRLHSVSSYREDILALQEYTRNRALELNKQTFIEINGDRIEIERAVMGSLISFSETNHTLVIGEPGAGKSGCMCNLANTFLKSSKDVVFLSADMMKSDSPEELAADLGLSRSRNLVDVLQNWSGDGIAFLIVDALDATRSGRELDVLCKVLNSVKERAVRWNIVASVREYDLRNNRNLQALFEGEPLSAFMDDRFSKVRHVKIDRLSSSEIAQVSEADESIRAVIENVPRVRELVGNPFNLNLLCKLIDQNHPNFELRSVRTQIDLLRMYWEDQVRTVSLAESFRVIDKTVDLMVSNRKLHISRSELIRCLPSGYSSIDSLLRSGVLVELVSRPGSDGKLAFAHNILFDYAVCRFWLRGLVDEVISDLSNSSQHDLFLAIYPSFIMAFEELWYSDESRGLFWERVIAFENSPGMRTVGKIIGPVVAAQLFRRVNDLLSLRSWIIDNTDRNSSLMHYTIQAALAQADATGQPSSIVGGSTPEWMELAVDLASDIATFAWDVHSLLSEFNKKSENASIEQVRFANASAKALLRHGIGNPATHFGVVRVSIVAVVLSFSESPEESASALESVLSDENIALGGHFWLHDITNHLELIAFSNPVFARRIVDVVFRANGDQNETVPMGAILTMAFNKDDMVDMAKLNVLQAYTKIWDHDPVTATQLMLTVMKSKLETDHPGVNLPQTLYRIPFRGGQATVLPDDSHLWSDRDYGLDEEWSQILSQFHTGLVNIAQSADNGILLGVILDVFRDEAEHAVVWRTLLRAASEVPESLGVAVVELLESPEILSDYTTRDLAGHLIQNGYQHFSNEERIAIENAILRIPDVLSENRRSRAIPQRNVVLGCIPPQLIQSPELVRIREELVSNGGVPPNLPAVSFSSSWSIPQEEYVSDSLGNEDQQIGKLYDVVKTISDRLRDLEHTSIALSEHLPSLEVVYNQLNQVRLDSPIIPAVLHSIYGLLVNTCMKMSSASGLTRELPLTIFLKQVLRQASHSLVPVYRPENDEQCDRGNVFWDSNSPRIDSAIGLMQLANNKNIVDNEILTDIERLADDDVPVVRFQVICKLKLLYYTSNNLMWSLVERTCKHEPRYCILKGFANGVILNIPLSDFERTEPFLQNLYRRFRRNDMFKDLRGAIAIFYLRGVLLLHDDRSLCYLKVFAKNPLLYSVEINRVIVLCRELIRYDESESIDENKYVREWTFAYLESVLITVRSAVVLIKNAHCEIPGDQWPKEEVEKYRCCHKIINNIAKSVYFGVGANGDRSGSNHDIKNRNPPTEVEKAQILSDGSSLFDALCDVEFVDSAYCVLQTLEFFVDTEQEQIILRIARLVRLSKSNGLQFESMANDRVVRIVERYLSEYGSVFRESNEACAALLDILDVFVEAGWPDATRLVYRFGEVFR
jgi:hypothetical protein